MTFIPTVPYVLSDREPLVDVPLPEEERGGVSRRVLRVGSPIVDVLTGARTIDDFPIRRARALQQLFIGHAYVSGSVKGDPQNRQPDFERLVDVDEVWVMCFRQPRHSQWRLMGRFIRKDNFVGLALYSRAYLGNRVKYHSIARAFDKIWSETVPQLSFHRGACLDEYISKPCRDLYADLI